MEPADPVMKKRLVSGEQLHNLLDFMREHPELAKGLSRGRRAKLITVKVWNDCAKRLNSISDGAVKDGKGWSKYWCDWKYRVRRHVLEIKVARDVNQTESVVPLSAIEEAILNIVSDTSIDDVVIQNDPLVDEESNDEDADQDGNESDVPDNGCYDDLTKYRATKRRHVSKDDSNHDEDDLSGPPEQRPRIKEAGETCVKKEDRSEQFLRIERLRFENAKKIEASICQISSDMYKLTHIMSDIRDTLVKKMNPDT